MFKRKPKLKNVPQKYLIIGVVSLTVNVVIALTLIVLYVANKSGSLDYAIVNDGINLMCSEQFRKTIEKSATTAGDSDNDKRLRLALVDYPCVKNGAKKFYEKGYKDYVHSLGLKTEDK